MKISDDLVMGVIRVEIPREYFCSVDGRDPPDLNALIAQLVALAKTSGRLPVYTSERYGTPFPFRMAGDNTDGTPERIVVG